MSGLGVSGLGVSGVGLGAEALGLTAGPALPPGQFARLERDLLFSAAKWDPQVGDVPALAPYPLYLDPAVWAELAASCEALAAEALVAEAAMLAQPERLGRLGLPRSVRALLADPRLPLVPTLARVMRFDLHPSTSGWALSEVNADVPGGFAESSAFPASMAAALGGAVCGDPLAALADAIAARWTGEGVIALVHATAYTDDRQVADGLASVLASRGVPAVPVAPDRLAWTDGRARLDLIGRADPVGGLWRFFPVEWLPGLSRRAGWANLVRGGRVPSANPGHAALLQSKRWTLLADELGVALPTWRALLPRTEHPSAATRAHPDWVLKPALGRIGEGVAMDGVTPERALRRARRDAWWWPGAWVVQRRFTSVPVQGPDGPVHVCLGVYVVDGRAAGVYGRISPRALIDGGAREVAVLLPSRRSP